MEVSKEILKWVVSGDKGISSLTLFALFCEIPIQGVYNYPSDNGDFGRCKRFLELLDQKDRERVLAQAGKISPQWAALVKNWERLENMPSHELYWELRSVLEAVDDEELKPCPFCGKSPTLCNAGIIYWIECPSISHWLKCQIIRCPVLERRNFSTSKEATAAWNERKGEKQ